MRCGSVAFKASKQQATVYAQAYVQEPPVVLQIVGYRNAKLKLSCCDSTRERRCTEPSYRHTKRRRLSGPGSPDVR